MYTEIKRIQYYNIKKKKGQLFSITFKRNYLRRIVPEKYFFPSRQVAVASRKEGYHRIIIIELYIISVKNKFAINLSDIRLSSL